MTEGSPGLDGAYRLVEQHVEQVTGADIAGHMTGRVSAHVEQEVRRLGMAGALDYLDALKGGDEESNVLLDSLLSSILVHETFFYRFASQLEALVTHHLPALIETTEGPLRLWSAGCSLGPEPYTLAMIAIKAARCLGRFRQEISVLGTDVCQAHLGIAAAGKYAESTIRELPSDLAREFLEPSGDSSYVVSEALRKRTRFLRHNLLDEPTEGEFDVISCRNVLIYLRPEARRQALAHLAGALDPGGVLIVGHSESLRDAAELFVADRRYTLGIYTRRGEVDRSGGVFPSSRVGFTPGRDGGTDDAGRESIKTAFSSPSPDLSGVTAGENEAPRAPISRGRTNDSKVASPRSPAMPRTHEIELQGDYDLEARPDKLEQLKSQLGDAIDLGADVVLDADGAMCLDTASASIVARAVRALESRGSVLVVRASRRAVRRWAERHRLPLASDGRAEETGPT